MPFAEEAEEAPLQEAALAEWEAQTVLVTGAVRLPVQETWGLGEWLSLQPAQAQPEVPCQPKGPAPQPPQTAGEYQAEAV